MKLKSFEVKQYLGGWIDNVGFSDRGVERTLMDAMRNKPSINEWFGVSEVDYDDEFALEYLRGIFNEIDN